MSLSSWSASIHSPFSCPQTFLFLLLYFYLGGMEAQTFAIIPVEQRDVLEVCGEEKRQLLGNLAVGSSLFFEISVGW